MAKVPPKKAPGVPPKKGPKPLAPQNRTPADADEALTVTRNALVSPKGKAMKGKPPC